MDKNEANKERLSEEVEEEKKQTIRTDSRTNVTEKVNGKFREYIDSLEIAEDVMQIYKAFNLCINTLMLAISIVYRVLIEPQGNR